MRITVNSDLRHVTRITVRSDLRHVTLFHPIALLSLLINKCL